MTKTIRLAVWICGWLCILGTSLNAVASPIGLKRKMIADLESIKGFFESKYAPLEWKKKFSGLDLELEFQTAVAQIESLSDPTTKDFHRILKNFLNTMKDYHVNVQYFSTEQAFLPFSVKGAEGRYFISYVEHMFSLSALSLNVGDEVVAFDGRPIDEVINQLKRDDLGNNTPETDQALAEQMLTARIGKRGQYVPQGTVNVTIKRKNGQMKNVSLKWDYTPEKIKDIALLPVKSIMTQRPSQNEDFKTMLEKSHFFEKKMINSCFDKAYLRETAFSQNPHIIGAWRSFIPSLGKKIWEGDKDLAFDAYIFEHEGKKFGYVRIPHFEAGESEVLQFQEIIKLFQKETEALVIDQINNPGGDLFYAYALASMLTNTPLETPKHRIALTQEEVYMAHSILPVLQLVHNDADAKAILGQTIGGYPINLEFVDIMKRFCRFIIEEWSLGNFLTRPTFVFGVDQIRPCAKARYTHPILFLTNETDFSGADFLALIMKKRAHSLGERTAGAGGYVINFTFPNQLGIERLCLTGSIAEGSDAVPLENNGVKPDTHYSMTVNDLQNNYPEYVNAIQKTLVSLISIH